MKVLITGGAGYVGTELVKKLTHSPAITEIIIYDNLCNDNHNFFLGKHFSNPGKIRFVNGEILDSRLLKKELKGVHTVVHLAAKVTTPFANIDPHFYEQVNHWGTAEVTYAIEESDVEKMIYLSSTSVYGANTKPADESTIPSPATYYGVSKLRGEEHVRRVMEKKNAIILRSGNVYGYSQSMRFDAVINRFMFDANFANRIQIFGTGKQTRAFIHVDKLTKKISEVILNQVSSGTYNLIDKNLQIIELLDALKIIYPSLEFIFSNQHMNLKELQVSSNGELFKYISTLEKSDIVDELREFKSHFAY